MSNLTPPSSPTMQREEDNAPPSSLTMEIEEEIYYDNGTYKQRSNGQPNMIINDGFGIDEYTLNPNGQTISIRRDGVNMFGKATRKCGRKQRRRVNKRVK